MTDSLEKALGRRVHDLDTIAAVLPMERRDGLAELLTDQDVETLRHLVNQGMGENTLRALTSDLAYLQAWSLAATGASLPWPAPEALLLKFVAHHLWDPEKRLSDPQHGMPAEVEARLRVLGFLRSPGPHAPDTVRRRLATWSTLTKWRGLQGMFTSPALKSPIRLSVRAMPRPRKRKSAKAVTGDVLSQLLATCRTDTLKDLRDRAILMVAFASGGRRRSEIAGLRKEQLNIEAPIPVDGGAPLPSLSIHLGRTKTSGGDNDEVVYLTGRPVEALNSWMAAARIERGIVFRAVDRWGMSLSAHSTQRPSTTSSTSARFWLDWIRPSFPPMACDQAISPKRPIAAFRCPRPWSSPGIDPCSRHRAITTARIGGADERQGS
ncbi:integrase [Rhizobium paknamense]|uniref:Integrase n=1 Tax=Rhizobium paknamense TaxID=1206817 RepID=A0ABU0IJ32_9HYPH|nr:integrase [Rhizobium paknamense]